MTGIVEDLQTYVDGVTSGDIVACKYVKQAVQRFCDDMAAISDGSSPYVFDLEDLYRWEEFSEHCTHIKGPLAGQPIKDDPWQVFIIANVLCFKIKATGLRRFREAYVEVARKNGKSTWGAKLGLFFGFFLGEGGAEVYSAAMNREQAREVWDVAAAMVRRSPQLSEYITYYKGNVTLADEATMSKFVPVSRDKDTLEGKNPFCAIVDEYHVHKTDEIYSGLDNGMGARAEPFMLVITTAGNNLAGPCKAKHDACIAVLDPQNESSMDQLLIFIATVDDPKEWQSEDEWRKANPNYGVSVIPERFHDAFEKAKLQPSLFNEFLTKRLNIWVGQAERWLKMEHWNECAVRSVSVDDLKGRTVWVGFDIGSTDDLTASAYLAWSEETVGDKPILDVCMRFWAPEEGAEVQEKKHGAPYRVWDRQGHLKLTPGGATDLDIVEEDILADMDGMEVAGIGGDKWNARQIVQHLDEAGHEVIVISQTNQGMTDGAKYLERLVCERRFNHQGHPILEWMAGNVSVYRDGNDNIKPMKPGNTKSASGGKIDGITAIVNALCLLALTEEPTKSIYETEGEFFL